VTGVSHLAPMKDQLLAMQGYKKFKTIGILYNPLEQNSVFSVDTLKFYTGGQYVVLTSAVDIDLETKLPISSTIPDKIFRLKQQGAEWLYLGPDTFVSYTHRQLTTISALRAGLPTFT
jgi:putative tryptophan/tyrosine transport system substrate-binding protein